METFIKLSEFFGGLIFFLSLGWLIGHLLKLEHSFEKMQLDDKNENQVENN
jgi:hypothetical protein